MNIFPRNNSQNDAPARRGFNRRRFLQTSSVASAAALTAGGLSPANAQSSLPGNKRQLIEPPKGELPFLHGVASGDPIPDSVILWTRVTASPEAMPGSGVGPDVTLEWEVATDEEMRDVVKRGNVVATAERDHTVNVDPHGLNPETTYFFRFRVTDGEHAGKASPVGRTKTAPAANASPEQLTFGVGSCANWESGFFSAYTDIAKRARAGQLDYMIFLGDYIYEYGVGKYSGFGPVRHHHPAHEIVSLQDYRVRFGRYRTDPELQAAHGALPWIVVWDDHETANNSWAGGAENHDPATEGDWNSRRAGAMQAYFEWMPVRMTNPSQDGHIYRSLTFGDLVELTMMDLRTYRDKELSWDPAGFAKEDRTMLGSEQYEWLLGKLETSQTAWNMLGNSVMFSPLNLITLQQDPQTEKVSSALSSNITGIPVNGDQWDGYSAERRRVIEALAAKGSQALFVTGDIHTEWAHNITHQGNIIGAELVCASVTAPNINEQLKLPQNNALSDAAEHILRSANPHCKHVDLDNHGYSFVTVRREEAEMHWLRVDDILTPGSPVRDSLTMTWRKGQGFK